LLRPFSVPVTDRARIAMAHIEIRRNEIADAALAERFERELAEATADVAEPLACVILDEGLHAEIEVELPGWTEIIRIPYPARAGDVRRAVGRLLRDVGLVDASPLRVADLTRGF
jgi:hypothetical protein